MAIDSPTLAQTMTWIYHRIWEEVVPVTAHDQPWENPLGPHFAPDELRHDDGIRLNHTRGDSPNRAPPSRRRDEPLRVVSHFSLGAAWSASHHRQHTGTKQPAPFETALSFDPRNRLESNVIEDGYTITRQSNRAARIADVEVEFFPIRIAFRWKRCV